MRLHKIIICVPRAGFIPKFKVKKKKKNWINIPATFLPGTEWQEQGSNLEELLMRH